MIPDYAKDKHIQGIPLSNLDAQVVRSGIPHADYKIERLKEYEVLYGSEGPYIEVGKWYRLNQEYIKLADMRQDVLDGFVILR